MAKNQADEVKLAAFRDAAQSLKLYRRAELIDESGSDLIERLYVDPLPGDHVLQTMLKPSTTFIIGRKGTGKSTVFQRAQYELRRKADVTTAYIDIKSVFEASQTDPGAAELLQKFEGALSPASLDRLLLHRNFITAIVKSIKSEVDRRVQGGLWERIKNSFSGTQDQLLAGLDAVLQEANSSRFESVVGAYLVNRRTQSGSTQGSKVDSGLAVTLADSPSLTANVSAGTSESSTESEELEQIDILMRVFDVRKIIEQLTTVLEGCGIRRLYVFLDDFSELPESALRVVVDALIAPLNNWSNELIKFKIAAYPNRVYYGQIDKTKIDEINLDLFNLYGDRDLVAMEEKAIDFTRRLVERRLSEFGATPIGRFFDAADSDDLWRQLFYATMANPRNIGYLLYFAYESALLYGKPIGAAAIRAAARRYYVEKIQAAFEMNRFLQESFDERSSIFSLKELLDTIVGRARELRNSDTSTLKDLKGRAPTSHFHIAPAFESLLVSLELNFFVTKYYVMRDRDGLDVTVYALNYGLCQKEIIEFGRPVGSREQRYRQYFAERIFDFTALMQTYVRTNQEIICDSCGERHDSELLPTLRTYGMLCPSCKIGTCEVRNLSRKYESILRAVDENSLLPRVELGIMQALGTESEPLGASEVAGELDCSYQLVGKRVKNLDDRGLVNRDQYDSAGRRVYSVTTLAKEVYFSHDG